MAASNSAVLDLLFLDDAKSALLAADVPGSPDVHAHYARQLIQSNLRASGSPSLPSTSQLRPDMHFVSSGPVGIIGAGIGGLYAGMILKSLGIPYQILEASGRTGGRFYTHRFSDGDYFVSSTGAAAAVFD